VPAWVIAEDKNLDGEQPKSILHNLGTSVESLPAIITKQQRSGASVRANRGLGRSVENHYVS